MRSKSRGEKRWCCFPHSIKIESVLMMVFFFWCTKYNSLLSDCADNVLFVWLAEVSADQTVDNFIIPWLKSECGLCSLPGCWLASLGPRLWPRSPGLAPLRRSPSHCPVDLGQRRHRWDSRGLRGHTGKRENYLKHPFIENGEFKTWGNALNIFMVTFVKGINTIL